MAVLTAYFDESGIHDDDPNDDHHCVVAGYVGNAAQWNSLAADWVPAIHPRKNLHLKKLRWNQHPKRIAPLLAKVGSLPGKYNLQPVYASIRWCDYKEVFAEKDPFLAPYVLCANLCLISVLLDGSDADDTIYFVFDRQEGMRREVMDRMRAILYDWIGLDRRVQDITFIPRDTTVCLDPPDFLSYMLHEQALHPSSVKVEMGHSIFEGKPRLGGFFSGEQLRWFAASMVKSDNEPPTKALSELMKHPFFRGPKR